MTDLRTAANTALYALEFNYPLIEDYGNKKQLDIHHEAIMALHKALAQPEQEPVCDKDPSLCGFTLCQLAKVCKHTPRNTMPTKIFAPNLEQMLNAAGFYRRVWVGLTDEEIKKIMQRWRNGYIDIKDAEQLLKDKNI
jgi:hypothetical protein